MSQIGKYKYEDIPHTYGGFALDHFGKRLILPNGNIVFLTRSETCIMLCIFHSKAGRATRKQIWENGFGVPELVRSRAIDQHIANLRKKLGEYGKNLIKEYGRGYRLVPSLVDNKIGV